MAAASRSVERFDAKLFMDEIDLGAAEPRDAEEVEQASGCLFAEAIEVAGFARLDQLLHHCQCCGSDAFGLLQLPDLRRGVRSSAPSARTAREAAGRRES
jgi:hypothetical protein